MSTILIDDVDLLCSIASEVLRFNGFTVICAESLQLALRLLEEYPVDLLVTGSEHGRADGYLIEAAQRLRPSIKCLLIADSRDNQGKMESSHATLLKPFSADGLLLEVRALLDRRSLGIAR